VLVLLTTTKRTLFAIFFMTSGQIAWAHHSTAIAYDTEKTQTITGTITRVEWKNPHVLLQISEAANGAPRQTWSIELPSLNNLARHDVKRESMHVGDAITVTGFPSRTTAELLSLKEATLVGSRRLVLDDAQLVGHHSYANIYDAHEIRTLTGSVSVLDLTGGRSFLYLDVKPTANSPAETWKVELPPPGILTKTGWPRNSIKAQDVLTVTGFAGKNATRSLKATEALLPDGSRWAYKP
jgi:hypothetical protein